MSWSEVLDATDAVGLGIAAKTPGGVVRIGDTLFVAGTLGPEEMANDWPELARIRADLTPRYLVAREALFTNARIPPTELSVSRTVVPLLISLLETFRPLVTTRADLSLAGALCTLTTFAAKACHNAFPI